MQFSASDSFLPCIAMRIVQLSTRSGKQSYSAKDFLDSFHM